MTHKISPENAHYRSRPNGNQQCSGCSMFRGAYIGGASHGRCTLVEGFISPTGWCKHYDAKKKSFREWLEEEEDIEKKAIRVNKKFAPTPATIAWTKKMGAVAERHGYKEMGTASIYNHAMYKNDQGERLHFYPRHEQNKNVWTHFAEDGRQTAGRGHTPEAVEKFLQKRKGIKEDGVPANAMGTSSSTAGSGGIDTFDPVLFKRLLGRAPPKINKRKRGWAPWI